MPRRCPTTPRRGPRRECFVIENSVPERNARASAQNARAFWNRERVLEAIEEELARLREKRPGLASRIDRAAHLLVTHLSDRRSGMIRVRVGSDRRPRFLVRSVTSGGIYVVDPAEAGWSCSCPDYHRRNAPCKHLVAAWCLKSVDRRARRKGAVRFALMVGFTWVSISSTRRAARWWRLPTSPGAGAARPWRQVAYPMRSCDRG
jgi:hypothetical protein